MWITKSGAIRWIARRTSFASVRSAATKWSPARRPDSGDRARSPCHRRVTARLRHLELHSRTWRPTNPVAPVTSQTAMRLLRRDLVCSETVRFSRRERAQRRPENAFRREVAHTPMMAFRAYRPLARSARYLMKYMPRMRMVRARPRDVRRSKQGDDGRVKGRREMAGTGIGRDQERRPAHAGLGEPNA